MNSKLVTGDSAFSMFNLSLREEWANNKTFCHRLTEEADAEDKAGEHAENNKAKVCYLKWISLERISGCGNISPAAVCLRPPFHLLL